MDYYKLLQLEREPFSNSPDPEFFFQSRQHRGCLQKLELALRLKRGLNVVMGDIGSGKTTLCREIIRKFSAEPEFETHLILDPAFASTEEFAAVLHTLLCAHPAPPDSSLPLLKEAIKHDLFHKGVEQNRTVILIIDEGQKITTPCIELLRELLNYETNTYKLLQIVIFAQEEFRAHLAEHPNFADRVNLLHHLGPLNFSDTRRLIRHRLKLASVRPKPIEPFTLPALWAIYRYSRGYPRRIIHLCHQSVLAMIIQNRTRAGWFLVRACLQRGLPQRTPTRRVPVTALAVTVGVAVLVVLGLNFNADLFLRNFFAKKLSPAPVQQSWPMPPANDVRSIIENKVRPDAPLQVAPPDAIAALEPLRQKPAVAEQPASLPPGPSLQTTSEQPAVNSTPLVEAEAAQPADPPASSTQPTSLGTTRVNVGDTLYHMITTIYGSYRDEYMQAVLSANPQIENPDTIRYGSTVSFPVLRFTESRQSPTACWVIVAQYPSLQQAHQAVLKLKRQSSGQPFRLLATWSPSQALVFHLVHSGAVEDRKSADAIVATLPPTLGGQARVLDSWPQETEFYSDPNISAATFANRRTVR